MLHEDILTYAMQRTERKARQLIGRNGFTKDDLQDLQSLTIGQIADEMHVSRTHVHKCIHEIQERFHEAGLNLYL